LCIASLTPSLPSALCWKSHGRIFLAPGLLSAGDLVADGAVLEEDPRLVDDELLERRGVRGLSISDDVLCRA
jgi:hypothetical protein